MLVVYDIYRHSEVCMVWARLLLAAEFILIIRSVFCPVIFNFTGILGTLKGGAELPFHSFSSDLYTDVLNKKSSLASLSNPTYNLKLHYLIFWST